MLDLQVVKSQIEAELNSYREAQIKTLNKLSLNGFLKGKNPYLLKVEGFSLPEEIISKKLETHISSGNEGRFGNLLERLAIFVNKQVYGGGKSTSAPCDLDFQNESGIRYLVSIKSQKGQNSETKNNTEKVFDKIRKSLRTSGGPRGADIQCVMGCYYGSNWHNVEGKNYQVVCGQAFWKLISGSDTLYTDILPFITSKGQSEELQTAVRNCQKRLQEGFQKAGLVLSDGTIDWTKWIELYFGSAQ